MRWCDVADCCRRALLESQFTDADGGQEMLGGVDYLVVSRLLNMTTLLGEMDMRSMVVVDSYARS